MRSLSLWRQNRAKKEKLCWQGDLGVDVPSFLRSLSKLSEALWRPGGKRKENLQLIQVSGISEYLHRKSRCEMQIGGDGNCWRHNPWQVFFNVCLHSLSFRLRADWRKSDRSVDGEPQGNWRWNSNSRDVVESSSSFSRPAVRAPRRACSNSTKFSNFIFLKCWKPNITMRKYFQIDFILNGNTSIFSSTEYVSLHVFF